MKHARKEENGGRVQFVMLIDIRLRLFEMKSHRMHFCTLSVARRLQECYELWMPRAFILRNRVDLCMPSSPAVLALFQPLRLSAFMMNAASD